MFDCEAIYIHAHKRDPFLMVYLASGITLGTSTYFLGRAYGAPGILTGWAVIMPLLTLGWSTRIFLKKRREWHCEPKQP